MIVSAAHQQSGRFNVSRCLIMCMLVKEHWNSLLLRCVKVDGDVRCKFNQRNKKQSGFNLWVVMNNTWQWEAETLLCGVKGWVLQRKGRGQCRCGKVCFSRGCGGNYTMYTCRCPCSTRLLVGNCERCCMWALLSNVAASRQSCAAL